MGFPFPRHVGTATGGPGPGPCAAPHPAAQRCPARQRNAARQPPAVPAHRPSPRGHRDGGHRWDGAPMRTCPRPSRRFPPASSRSLPWHPHRTSMAQHAPQRRAGPVADRGDTRHDLSICNENRPPSAAPNRHLDDCVRSWLHPGCGGGQRIDAGAVAGVAGHPDGCGDWLCAAVVGGEGGERADRLGDPHRSVRCRFGGDPVEEGDEFFAPEAAHRVVAAELFF